MMKETTREAELEDRVALLESQLHGLTGSNKELGVLMSQRHGMTQRAAQILHILVNRAPAVVSRDTLHQIFYGDRADGGPEPKIFNVYKTRLNQTLGRLEATGRIETIWNAGYRASPELVRWVQGLYAANIKED